MVFEGLLSDLIDCFWWFDDSSAESFGVHAPNSKESRGQRTLGQAGEFETLGAEGSVASFPWTLR